MRLAAAVAQLPRTARCAVVPHQRYAVRRSGNHHLQHPSVGKVEGDRLGLVVHVGHLRRRSPGETAYFAACVSMGMRVALYLLVLMWQMVQDRNHNGSTEQDLGF